MIADRSLKIALVCLVINIICWAVRGALGDGDGANGILIFFCALPLPWVWIAASIVGTIAGLYATAKVIQFFGRTNRAELSLLICILLTIGNAALIGVWFWLGLNHWL